MPWFLRIGAAYIGVAFISLVAAFAVSRAHPMLGQIPISVSGEYELVIVRYAPMPFVNGPGRSPGEIRLIDGESHVLDSEPLDDVLSVGNITWELPHARFTYERGGKIYAGDLTTEPL